jgi:hypothetical protein
MLLLEGGGAEESGGRVGKQIIAHCKIYTILWGNGLYFYTLLREESSKKHI